MGSVVQYTDNNNESNVGTGENVGLKCLGFSANIVLNLIEVRNRLKMSSVFSIHFICNQKVSTRGLTRIESPKIF